MRNKDLPKLLRAIANSEQAKQNHHSIIFNQAADELEKLDQLETIMNSLAASRESVLDLINDKA